MNKKENKISKEIKINKKSARRNYLNQTGITLIALVVTIVVLLILAGVSINAIFGNSGIIEKAKDAQNKMNNAQESDLNALNDLDEWINNQVNGTTGGNTGKDDDKPFGGEKYNKAEKNNDGTLKANTEYTDSENTTVTIPKGFKVSDVAKTEDTDGEQTVSTGLVIQDAEENEFVWVPVNYTATGTLDDDGLDSGFKNTFKRSTTSSRYTEPYASGYGENGAEEKSDYLKMMKSVQSNKGFYIGRYEAGTTEPRTSSTTTSSKVVVKRDAYPYNYVGWGNAMNDITTDVTYDSTLRGKGAVYLSKHMYEKKDIGATSTLCYGVQWDAAMKFVSSTNDISNSTNWGNYKNNAWTITRTTASYSEDNGKNYTPITSSKEKTSSESILLTTGASDSFKAKNIFDLAGNVYEWTMEAYYSTTRVSRGGHSDSFGSSYPASTRSLSDPAFSLDFIGFRSALYL